MTAANGERRPGGGAVPEPICDQDTAFRERLKAAIRATVPQAEWRTAWRLGQLFGPELAAASAEPVARLKARRAGAGETAFESFKRFDTENPELYGELVRLALAQKRDGRDRSGISALVEDYRWERPSVSSDEDADGNHYKIRALHAAAYSRKIMRDFPELEGFFVLRASVFDAYLDEL